MSFQHTLSNQLLPVGTDVPLDECFPVDDAPARSPDCVSFGPHNVLQVCSRWSIAFFLSNLLSPARQCQIRHHPLCHRSDLESIETVVGAKWSPSLLPEVFYPACARVCVQTTSNLVVYRVARRGAGRVEVSGGVGIACCRRCTRYTAKADSPPKASGKASSKAAKSSTNATVAPNTAAAAAAAEVDGAAVQEVGSHAPSAPASTTGASPKRKPSAKTAKPTAATSKKTAAPVRKRQRQSRSSDSSEVDDGSDSNADTESDSSSSSSSSSETSSSSSSDSSDSDAKGKPASKAKRTPAQGASKKRGERVVKAAMSSKKGEALEGKQIESTQSNSPTAASPRADLGTSRCLPVEVEDDEAENAWPTFRSEAALVDYLWLDNDDLVVLTTHGLHVVSFYGDFSDEDGPVVRDLPPPLYTWGSRDDVAHLGFQAPAPVCFSAIAADALGALAGPAAGNPLTRLRRTVVAASPYLLRVLHVSAAAHAPGSRAKVQLVQYVEVPALVSIPSAVCAVAATLRSHPTAPSTSSATDTSDAAETVVFLAAPCLVLRGRITLSLPATTAASSELPLGATRWTADGHFGPDQIAGEVSLRAFAVAPFAAASFEPWSDAAPGSTSLTSSTASERPATAATASRSITAVSTAVLGIGERALVEFLLAGPSSVTLFQCPLLAGRTAMPAQKCAGVAGVALHPGGAVAMLALQSGHARREPLHLQPVVVDNERGWLRRFIELAGVLRTAPSDRAVNTDAFQNRDSDRALSGLYGDNEAETGTPECTTVTLVHKQASEAYFLRERLLGGSTAQSSDLHRYAQVWHVAHQMPSEDTLRHYRAGSVPRPHALSIADLDFRHVYLQRRTQHGVALFLRWPLPTSAAVPSQTAAASVFASASEMAAQAAAWPWWRLLRHIWASCPWDRPVLQELVLSNAICILAKRHGYANMAFAVSERYRERDGESAAAAAAAAPVQGTLVDPSTCSTDPDTVDVDGARCYVEAYVRQQEEVLKLALAGEAGGALSSSVGASSVVLTAADCATAAVACCDSQSQRSGRASSMEQARQVHWCVSEAWVQMLKAFLASISGGATSSAVAGASSSSALLPTKEVSATAVSDSPITAAPRVARFPCSLCDRDKAAVLDLSLSCTSLHTPPLSSSADDSGSAETTLSSSAAPVAHTTLFSGTTFSPLSFFSPDYVLTRCVACGLSDYADGPLCRVCGGLLE